MSPDYEMTLRKEVLLEKGAAVLAELLRYKQSNHIEDDFHPVSIIFALVWNAKEEILAAKNDADLDRIDGKFDMASSFATDIAAGKVS